VRGENNKAKKDGIYRAGLRGDSTYVRAQVEKATAELTKGNTSLEPGRLKIRKTRKAVEDGWRSVISHLEKDTSHDLASEARRFVDRFPAVRTEREGIALELQQRVREPRFREELRAR
jgi:hypothetical protein